MRWRSKICTTISQFWTSCLKQSSSKVIDVSQRILILRLCLYNRVERKWPLTFFFRFKFCDSGKKLHFRFKKKLKKFGFNSAISSGAAKSLKFWKKNWKIIKFEKKCFLWIFYTYNVAKDDLNIYLRFRFGKKNINYKI